MKRYKRKFKEAEIKGLEYYINFYEQGYNQFQKLKKKLQYIEHDIPVDIIEVKAINGWAMVDIYFKDQNDNNEEISNIIRGYLNKYENKPIVDSRWSHGDKNRITIELNQMK